MYQDLSVGMEFNAKPPTLVKFNKELKEMLDLVFAAAPVINDIMSKSYFSLIYDVMKMMGKIPGALDNMGAIREEIAALPGSDAQADLIEYIQKKFEMTGSAKAQLICSAALKLVSDITAIVQDGVTLKSAIES